MLATDPAQRPDSMTEAIGLLENPPRPSRRAVLVGGAAASVAACGVALAYFKPWRKENPKPQPPVVQSFSFTEEQLKAAAEYDLPVERIDEYGVPFVLIPPGQTWVGTAPDEIERLVARERDNDYYPYIRAETRRVIEIARPFYLARTELTIGQMKALIGTRRRFITEVESGKYKGFGVRNGRWIVEADRNWHHAGPEFPLTDEHPAINLTWFDTTNLARMISSPAKDGPKYYLPTEDTWEYACLAGAADRADAIEDSAVFDVIGPLPVKSRLPNRWGLYDMLGNLLEWCLFAPQGVRGDSNLQAPLRGGKFNDKADRIRPAARIWATKSTPYGGVRLAMAAVPSPSAKDRAFTKIGEK